VHSTALADSPSKKVNRQKSIDFIAKIGSQELFRLFIPGLVALEHRGRLREQLTVLVNQTSDRSILAGLSAMKERPSHLETIAQLDKPILFMKGDEDTHYSADEIYTQAAASICQLSVLQGVGHLAMLEDPEKCLVMVQRFLFFVKAIS
jgi:pimeloyl-ACP methyl ester carboxylesterase